MDKYNVKTYNSISHLGLEKIKHLGLSINSGKTANAILLRSHKLSSEEIKESVYGVFRAGAGTNNIPIDFCTSKGIAVFNTQVQMQMQLKNWLSYLYWFPPEIFLELKILFIRSIICHLINSMFKLRI